MSSEITKLEHKLDRNMFDDRTIDGKFYTKTRHGNKITNLIMDDLDYIRANRDMPFNELIEKLHYNEYKDVLI